ncbi:class I SAM-dependent methyltransferase [Aestuariivivens sediminis]|uniref:methyltransferase domain-containing protein n=1 Tax=Aestuariivivens sediminis TaxID=2913557 RepID=UPI001F582A14|nr:class I SAM-dependent methyltransferase [Aestuariivivens sediminis]
MKGNSQHYYDSIANNYESLLEEYKAHKSIRSMVQKEFIRTVPQSSKVLDFGGGTGLDLDWLVKDYKVTFWEPSQKMRAIAKMKIKTNDYRNIICIANRKNDLDSLIKTVGNVTFDAVLANFAVLNSIQDLHHLATKLQVMTSERCDLFFLVLYRFPHTRVGRLRDYYFNMRFYCRFHPKRFHITHNNIVHDIFVHPLNHIKRSFNSSFKLISVKQINNSYFKLLHLKKKP